MTEPTPEQRAAIDRAAAIAQEHVRQDARRRRRIVMVWQWLAFSVLGFYTTILLFHVGGDHPLAQYLFWLIPLDGIRACIPDALPAKIQAILVIILVSLWLGLLFTLLFRTIAWLRKRPGGPLDRLNSD
jgi:hypothetical protein